MPFSNSYLVLCIPNNRILLKDFVCYVSCCCGGDKYIKCYVSIKKN